MDTTIIYMYIKTGMFYHTHSSCPEIKEGTGKPLPSHLRYYLLLFTHCLQCVLFVVVYLLLLFSVEVQIYRAKKAVNGILAVTSKPEEKAFWDKHLSAELKPVTVRLQQASKEIGQKLKDLRNATLALILLVNILWIILLYTVTFPQLVKYNLPEKAFQLLFLAVYGIIIIVSFFAMLAHRFVMLMHFLGRPEVVLDAVQTPYEEPVEITSHT